VPVHAVAGGFRFGKTGKVFKSKAKAEAQARAIYSSGWRDDQKAKLARAKLHAALSAPRAAEHGYVTALVGLLAGVHKGVLAMVKKDILPHRPPPPEPEERQDVSREMNLTKGERPTSGPGEALEPGLPSASAPQGDGSAREDAVKDPKKGAYSAAISKAWGSGKLGDAVAKHLRLRVTVAFAKMAKKVDANGQTAATLLGIQPSAAGLQDIVDDAREASIGYLEAAARDYADEVRSILEDPDNFELPVDELADLIEERAGVSASRARTIATTSTLQLNSTLTTTRQRASGVKRFVWSSSRDIRVRGAPGGPYAKADPSHYDLDGQEFDYDDPPESDTDGEPALPGIPINCRCCALPVLEELEGEEGPSPDEESDDEAAERRSAETSASSSWSVASRLMRLALHEMTQTLPLT
jgi:SPP1 gp7 family putative phage head morphogenesis protein